MNGPTGPLEPPCQPVSVSARYYPCPLLSAPPRPLTASPAIMTAPPRRRVLHYEHRSQPVIPRRLFVRRILYHAVLACAVVSVSLVIGVLGYRFFAGLSWIDALMNAAMILGGMGPVNELSTTSGKLFASFYALYAGVAFLAIAAVLIAPFAHRLLHSLHLDDTDG